MKKKSKDEYVLVFPSSLLKEIGYFQGLTFDFDRYVNIFRRKSKFIRRSIAEKNENYKQLIPYVILYNNNQVFSYRRGALLSEERLLGKYSIGIGGHISVNDPNLFTTSYEEGMRREIKEEVYIDSKYTVNQVALLNDDSDSVGRVHFGLIFVLNLEKPSVKKREKSINEPKFIPLEELKNKIDKYENWSQICIKHIDQLIKSTT